MGRTLTTIERAGFLVRNPAVAARVTMHEWLVDHFGWDQMPGGPWQIEYRAIPTWGLAVSDSLGTVVIFPDASGTLRFTVHADGSFDPEVVNAPVYQSPTNNSVAQSIEDLKMGVSRIGVVLIAVYLVGTWLQSR